MRLHASLWWCHDVCRSSPRLHLHQYTNTCISNTILQVSDSDIWCHELLLHAYTHINLHWTWWIDRLLKWGWLTECYYCSFMMSWKSCRMPNIGSSEPGTCFTWLCVQDKTTSCPPYLYSLYTWQNRPNDPGSNPGHNMPVSKAISQFHSLFKSLFWLILDQYTVIWM